MKIPSRMRNEKVTIFGTDYTEIQNSEIYGDQPKRLVQKRWRDFKKSRKSDKTYLSYYTGKVNEFTDVGHAELRESHNDDDKRVRIDPRKLVYSPHIGLKAMFIPGKAWKAARETVKYAGPNAHENLASYVSGAVIELAKLAAYSGIAYGLIQKLS